MKRKVELYNRTKTYIFPSMEVATPEVVQMNYAVINTGLPVLIETDESGTMFYSIELLVSARGRMGIEPVLSNEEALKAIEDVLNAPQPEPEPTAEERIAAAMEYQNLISM